MYKMEHVAMENMEELFTMAMELWFLLLSSTGMELPVVLATR